MTIENIYASNLIGFQDSGGNGYTVATWDIDIPAQRALAQSVLSWVEGGAFCGVAGYTTAGHSELHQIPYNPAFGTPVYAASNVTSFTFIYGVSSGRASCNFTIFGL